MRGQNNGSHWVNTLENALVNESGLEAIQKASMIKNKHIPLNIIKYSAFNHYSLNNLRNDTIWYSHPEDFNDPYDSSFSIDLITDTPLTQVMHKAFCAIGGSEYDSDTYWNTIEDVGPIGFLKQRGMKEEEIESLLDSIKTHQDMVIERLRVSMYVCSFSERIDSPLMWAHYADNHQGFAIAYNSEEHKENLWPVIYDDKRVEFNLDLLVPGTSWLSDALQFSLHALISKAKNWEYEKEWRLISFDINRDQCESMEIKTLYIGANACQEHKQTLIDIAHQKNIECYQMMLSHTEFTMKANYLD